MSTATPVRPGRPDRPSPPPPPPPTRKTTPARPVALSSGTRRTVLALFASGLGVVPLMSLFTDSGWLVDVWLAMLVVVGPAALLRLRRPPSALDVWPGVVLLIPWLTLRFVPDHAFAGLIPTRATAHDISLLMDDLHQTSTQQVAPVHTTVAIRLVLCALLALLAALIDLIAVVGRRGALAGVPLLVVYTVAGAVPRAPVSWVWFSIAAVGFLVLLGLDASDELQRWGRRIQRRGGGTRAQLVAPFSAQRIGVVAIVIAVLVPLLLPVQSRNLITDLFRSGSGSGDGDGNGVGTGGISPFAKLKGQLTRGKPVDLVTVQVDNWKAGDRAPFYLRYTVLDTYDADAGWSIGDADSLGSVNSRFGYRLPAGKGRSIDYSVAVTVKGLTGEPPLFARSRSYSGIGSGDFKDEFQVMTDAQVRRGQTYRQTFSQPAPTGDQLDSAGSRLETDASPWLRLPALPKTVDDLVAKLTRGKSSSYQKARAISDYFADPNNDFQYSLKTKDGDSGSALVDFLNNKIGYCQQYAAAMAVMLRDAGVPARVVLGYMHPQPDATGKFTVTTNDAHAWVEAYFQDIGWVPFDPTPIAGLDGGQQGDINYAPHSYPSSASAASSSGSQLVPGRSTSQSGSASTSASTAAAAATSSGGGNGPRSVALVLVLLVLALALTPASLRLMRRRRRIAAARAGNPDALWTELADTALDLGYPWSSARSPRQVAAWLAPGTKHGPADATLRDPLRRLAAAVEQYRYGPRPILPLDEAGISDTGAAGASGAAAAPASTERLEGDFRQIVTGMRQERSWSTRVRATMWPASLGLRGRIAGLGLARGRRERGQAEPGA